MNRIYCIIAALLALPMNSLANEAIKKPLWASVQHCYNLTQELDTPSVKIIEDLPNGYLSVDGTIGTCGCRCSSRVAAFRIKHKQYLALMRHTVDCDYSDRLDASQSLHDIFPKELDITSFMPHTPLANRFYISINPPQTGTRITAELRLLPIGMKRIKESVFEHKQNGQSQSVQLLQHIAQSIKHENTLTYLLTGDFDRVHTEDKQIIDALLKTRPKWTWERATKKLIALKQLHETFESRSLNAITLTWVRSEQRFMFHERIKKQQPQSFKAFLLSQTFWSATC